MGQTIKIASVEVTEGNKKDGSPWKKYTVVGEDDSKLSTFDSKASSLSGGDTIEADIEVKGKFTNIVSFKLLSKGIAKPETRPEPKPEPMPPDKWADKDRITRRSIERQKSADIAFEYFKDRDFPTREVMEVAELIYQWISGDAQPTATPRATKSSPPEEHTFPPLKDVGALFNRGAEYGISSKDIMEVVSKNTGQTITKPQDIKNYDIAWALVATQFAETIRATQEAN